MSWKIGNCNQCGHPRGPFMACVFRVRVMRQFMFVRWRAWSWHCDNCCRQYGEPLRIRRWPWEWKAAPEVPRG